MKSWKNSSLGKHKKRKLIQIRVTYLNEDLQRLTGRKEEIISVPEGIRSGDFFDLLEKRYPTIFKKFGPGYLGLVLNGEKPHVLTLLRDGDHYEFTTWTDEEILQDELAKRFRGEGAIMELPKGEFKMPEWMECTWRRVHCGKDDCPVCGRIKRDRQKHIERGEDPDDPKSVFEDVGQNFKEALEMIKKDCEAQGIKLTNIKDIKEPPEPEKFPLYRKVKKWRNRVFNLITHPNFEFWLYTEPVQDLLWYINTLTAKTYRQLCNKWHIENGDEYGDFDHQYTGRILKETLKILKKSLRELSRNNLSQRKELGLMLSELFKLEKQIIKI